MKTKLHIVLIITLSLLWLILPQAVCLGATTNQISQFGITWTFDREYEYGEFANGDYWVVGPITITGIDPASVEIDGRTKNGSMVNPSPTTSGNGYDSTLGGYDVNLNVAYNISGANPLILENGSSLVSMISREEPDSRPRMQSAAILTVLSTVPSPGSFRPPYCGSDKSIKYNKSDLNYSLIAHLAPVGNTPDIATVERYFERPWIDHQRGWTSRYQHPSENMPDYGREISVQIGVGALMLHLNFTNQEKETLLIRYIQLGIDMHGIVQDGGGHNWTANGGHASGRKWPILFAGLILDDDGMKNIGNKSGDYLYSNGYSAGNGPGDYIHFGEDDQTFYVKKHPDANPPSGNTDYDIYVPPYAIHGYHYGERGTNIGTVTVIKGSTTVVGSGTEWTNCPGARMFGVSDDGEIWDPKGKAYYMVNETVIDDTHLELTEPYRGNPEDPDGTVYSGKSYIISDMVYYGHGQTSNYTEAEEYVNKDAYLPEWGIRHANFPYMDNKNWGTPYRQSCTAHAWAGFVLAAHIMNVKDLWNHDALFDYQDRFMQIQKETVGVGHWTRQWSKFTETMWDTYRASYGSVWSPETAQAPIAIISANPTSGQAPLTVNFDASPSYDPDGDIEKYEWDFEIDGVVDAQGVTTSYTYNTVGTCTAKLTVTDNQGLTGTVTISITASVTDSLADRWELSCYNNVFNPTKGEKALIVVELPKQAHVKLDLYNTKGNKIRELADEQKEPGTHKYYWDGKSGNGDVVGSGLYFVHIQVGDYKRTKKIVVIK